MYTLKQDISQQVYDDFVANHPYGSLLQTSQWAIVKSDWESLKTAVYDEQGNIVAAALILIRRMKGLAFGYIPRGPIMDYSNKELVAFYMASLKQLAKEKKWLFIKFDPKIIKRSAAIHAFHDTPDREDVTTLVSYVTNNGVKHLGYSTELSDTIQPRFEALIEVDDFDEKKLSTKNRNCIVASRKRQVSVSQHQSDGVQDLAKVIEKTMARKQINLRQADYFNLIVSTYGQHSTISLAGVDVPKAKLEVQSQIEDMQVRMANNQLTERKKKQLQEELLPLEKRQTELHQMPDTYVVMSGGLSVGCGKVLEQIYAGFDEAYKNFYPQYLLYSSFVDYARENGYKRVNLGGVENDLAGGLTTFKSKFNPTVEEYVGEFDLVVSPLYYAVQFALKARKKLKSLKKK